MGLYDLNLKPGSRVVLYVRVSTKEQIEGWSPVDQEEILRKVSKESNFRVVAVCQDLGDSGMYLERVGLEEAMDHVEEGRADAVIAVYRSRISRRNSHVEFLREWFRDRGGQIVALNTSNDGSPDGFLPDQIQGIFDEYEPMLINQRMQGGKLRRAREGNVVPTHTPPYGFRYSGDRTGFVVDETMETVERIFRLVGVEGRAMHAVKTLLDKEGVPPPGSLTSGISGLCSVWQKTFIQRLIKDDTYRPHTKEELRPLVQVGNLDEKVFASLSEEERYGVWWFNTTHKKVVDRAKYTKPDGTKGYKNRHKTVDRPKEEHITVPVVDSGIPVEWVDAARERIADNRRPVNTNKYFYVLSGGMGRCGHCVDRQREDNLYLDVGKERKLYTNTVPKPHGQVPYYRCAAKKSDGNLACEGGNWGAKHVEDLVWTFVKELLTRPEVVMTAVDAAIEQEADNAPSEEAMARYSKAIRDAESERLTYVKLYASGKGVIRSEAELEEHTRSCDERIADARAEIEKLARKGGKLESLRTSKQEMRAFYERRGTFALENATDEHKRRIYDFLRLRVYLYKDPELKGKRNGKADYVRVKGRIVENIWGEEGCTFRNAVEVASMYNFTNRMSLACGMIPNEEYHALAR